MRDEASLLTKPRLGEKAPEVFRWPENRSWNPEQRLQDHHRRDDDPDPDPWNNKVFTEIVDEYARSYTSKKTFGTNAVWYWGHKGPDNAKDGDELDRFTTKDMLTICWTRAIKNAQHC